VGRCLCDVNRDMICTPPVKTAKCSVHDSLCPPHMSGIRMVIIVPETNAEVKESMVNYLPKYHEEAIDIWESIIGYMAVYVWLFQGNRMCKHIDTEHVAIE
jgi:hypothetical protein